MPPTIRQKILVVEDDPDQKALIGIILEFGGYAILSAADGGQAIAQAGYVRPSLIILDIMLLGDMDGMKS